MSLAALLSRFAGRRLCVLGDLVLDEYVYGRTQRVSREAPVLIVRHDSQELVLGGGANAAANLAALGAKVTVVGLCGDDEWGVALRRLLRERGISPAGLVAVPGRATARKTRILAGDLHTTRQQVLRIDREGGGRAGAKAEAALERALRKTLAATQGLLISDYGDGAVPPALIVRAVEHARAGGLVCADSRHNVADYRGIPWVTPNEPEAATATGAPIEDETDARRAGKKLLRTTGGAGVLLTRGAQGLALFERGRPARFVPPFGGVDVADVTGAGDTVAAIFTLALAVGASPTEAALLANIGGGLVVAKRGTATLSVAELGAGVAAFTASEARA